MDDLVTKVIAKCDLELPEAKVFFDEVNQFHYSGKISLMMYTKKAENLHKNMVLYKLHPIFYIDRNLIFQGRSLFCTVASLLEFEFIKGLKFSQVFPTYYKLFRSKKRRGI